MTRSRYHSHASFSREHRGPPSRDTVQASCEWLAGEAADAIGQAFAVLCHPRGDWAAFVYWHRHASELATLAADWSRFAR
jgi:hypothetical protein